MFRSGIGRQYITVLLLGAAGFLVNSYHLVLFFDLEYFFGSVFVLLAGCLFGVVPALLAALIAACAAFIHWQDPVAVGMLILEAVVVASLYRRKIQPFIADMYYWLVAFPAGWLVYYLGFGTSAGLSSTVMLKLVINSLCNALLVFVILQLLQYQRYRRTLSPEHRLEMKSVVFSSIMLLVLIPGMVFTTIGIRHDMAMEERTNLMRTTQGVTLVSQFVKTYIEQSILSLEGVGRIAAERIEALPEPRKQDYLEKLHLALPGFQRLGIFDSNLRSIALASRVESHREFSSGIDFSHNPLHSSAKETLKPVVGDVMLNQLSESQPLVGIAVPVLDKGRLKLLAAGAIDPYILNQFLKSFKGNSRREVTLLDRNRRVVASTRKELKMLDELKLAPGHERIEIVPNSWKVVPVGDASLPRIERWNRATVVSEGRMPAFIGWYVVVDYPYESLVNEFNRMIASRLGVLLGLAISATLLANLLSHLFLLPLRQFQQLSEDMPRRMERNDISFNLRPSFLLEIESLTSLFQGMAEHILELFRKQKEFVLDLDRQVADRTRQLRILGDNLPQGAIFQGRQDKEGNRQFLYLSRGIEQVLGIYVSEGMESMERIFRLVHLDDLPRLEEDIVRSMTDLALMDGIYRTWGRDGELHWMRVLCKPRREADGSTIWDGLILDESERHAMELELTCARETAEAANRAKSQFLATMSHEIRTPLNAMLGILKLLGKSPLNPEQRQYLKDSESASQSLLQVINDILDFSKIEAGKLELVNATFDLFDQVNQLKRMFGPNANQKGLELFCKIAPNVPEMLIGDQYRLQQILSNLLSNAVKFTQHGSVELEALLVHEAKIGSGTLVQLEFRVKDTGVGIPEDLQEHIFESFTQLENFVTRSQGGTGLGLAICSRLATLMGGGITLTSEPGKGSTFIVHLPFFVGDEKQLKAYAPQSGDYSRRLPREILLADDDEMNRMVVSTLLKTEGHRVTAVEDGEGLLGELAKRRFDIVLTDISMPGLEGSQVAEIIRSGQREGIASDIPIIAMTAHAFPQDRERFLASGINGYVSKPINYEELLQLIEGLCGDSAASEAAGVDAVVATDEVPSAAQTDEILDTEYLRRNYSSPGMDEMMRYAANLFVKRSQEIGPQLSAAVDGDDIAQVKHLAHKFFGVAGTVGARQLGRLVREIEYAAINQQMPEVKRLLDGLESDLQKAAEAVRRYAGI